MNALRMASLAACLLLALHAEAHGQIYQFGDAVHAGSLTLSTGADGKTTASVSLDGGATKTYDVEIQGHNVTVKKLYGTGDNAWDVTFKGLLKPGKTSGNTTDKHGPLGNWERVELTPEPARTSCGGAQVSASGCG